jgi:hypothetical protein
MIKDPACGGAAFRFSVRAKFGSSGACIHNAREMKKQRAMCNAGRRFYLRQLSGPFVAAPQVSPRLSKMRDAYYMNVRGRFLCPHVFPSLFSTRRKCIIEEMSTEAEYWKMHLIGAKPLVSAHAQCPFRLNTWQWHMHSSGALPFRKQLPPTYLYSDARISILFPYP